MISMHKVFVKDVKKILLFSNVTVPNKVISLIIAFLFVSLHGAVSFAKQPDCAFLPKQSAIVSHVTSEKIVVLKDGRKLKITNVKFLTADLHPLISNLKNQQIDFYSSGRLKDRYGRLLVQIITQENDNENDQEQWLQAQLIEGGHALANATSQNSGCSLELLKLERTTAANGRRAIAFKYLKLKM